MKFLLKVPLYIISFKYEFYILISLQKKKLAEIPR